MNSLPTLRWWFTLHTHSLLMVMALVAALTPQVTWAVEIPGDFTAVRPIGMGDAYTGVANDESGIWTNPAGLGRVRKARSRSTFNITKVPNIIGGGNGQSRNFYDAFKGAQEKSVEGVITQNSTIADKPFYVRGAAFPVTMFDAGRNAPMAIGLFTNTTVQALIPKETPDTAQVTAISDAGGVVSFSWTNDANRFNIGMSLRPTLRYAFEDRIPSGDLIKRSAMQTHLQSDSNKLSGNGIDFGMMYTVADFWFPTVGFAVRNVPTGCKAGYLNPYTEKLENVCGNVYRGSLGNTDALSTVDPTDVRAGISIIPRLTNRINLRFAVDAHHIPLGTASQSLGLQGLDASKMVHAGGELFYGNPLLLPAFCVRAGISQGFATGGFSVNMGVLALDFATYGVDVSSSSKPVEDRRFLGSLSMDL